MKKFLFLLMGGILALTSCENSETISNAKSGEVSFNSRITRVTGNTFDENDEISVNAYNEEKLAKSADYTYHESAFTSTDPIILTKGSKLSYIAVYPKQENNTTESFNFSVEENQSEVANFTKSDLLVAKLDATDDVNPSLTFNHKMSSIIINVKVEKGTADLSTAIFNYHAKKSVDANLKDMTFTTTGDAVDFTPYIEANDESQSYSVVLAPQTVGANSILATIRIGENTFNWILKSNMILESGKQYIYNWNINIPAKTSEIKYQGQINDWDRPDVDPTIPTDPSTTPSEPSTPTQEETITLDAAKILKAMGLTEIETNVGVDLVTEVNFENFSLIGAKGATTTASRLWNNKGVYEIRTYAGNTMTFKAKNNKKITKIEFSVSSLSESSNGTVDGKSWTSADSEGVDEVTLTTSKSTNKSIAVTIK